MFLYPLGGGVGLGPLEPWHAEEFAAAVDKAREHLAPWVPFAHTVTDVDSARELLQRMANEHAADTRHMYGIWLDGSLVGGALFPAFDTRNGLCELGVWLVPEVQGRGIITEAARYLVDWAIRVRGMSRVAWHNDVRNARSRAVAQRLGMTLEGVQRSSHVVAGERQDCEVWSVLAPEWPASAGTAAPLSWPWSGPPVDPPAPSPARPPSVPPSGPAGPGSAEPGIARRPAAPLTGPASTGPGRRDWRYH